ncbi:hypothetical protein, partial [Sphingobacterium multivorum]|uniref:hypothetical protein n=1 Tax=Sphingobacterium multivorum TaxID=28454 RepID=UPI003DA640EB
NLRRLFGPLTSEIIGKSNRINWPIDLRYRHDARKLLSEHHITLKDDFKIISNQSGGLRDYTHQFELSISEKDKQSFIDQRSWSDKMDERIEVHTTAVDRYEGDTLRANYHDKDSYIYSM